MSAEILKLWERLNELAGIVQRLLDVTQKRIAALEALEGERETCGSAKTRQGSPDSQPEADRDGPEELRTEVYVSVSVVLGRGLNGHEAMIAEEAMKATLRARTQQEPEGDGMQLTEEDIRDAFQGEDVTPGWAQCNRVADRLSATLRAQPRRMGDKRLVRALRNARNRIQALASRGATIVPGWIVEMDELLAEITPEEGDDRGT